MGMCKYGDSTQVLFRKIGIFIGVLLDGQHRCKFFSECYKSMQKYIGSCHNRGKYVAKNDALNACTLCYDKILTVL